MNTIRIRFHGRGGHGVKTAGRIVGTAAFRAGFQAQDSPVYGAERRGAAVLAFTRIGESAILERGAIEHPDLIVIGDETLLDDPIAQVLAGQQSASAVFVNAESSEAVSQDHRIGPRLITLDVTARTLAALGKASALSAGLAAAAARLIGYIGEEHLLEAVREELEHVEVPAETIAKNVDLARGIFAELPVVELGRVEVADTGEVVAVRHAEVPRSAPSILDTGNAVQRHTGSWRVERPVIDTDRCTRCGICFVRCPDGAIALDEHGYPVVDYDHCKGCMICWQQCPVGGIEREREVRSW